MPSFSDITNALVLGSQVSDRTGNDADSMTAAGFGAFVSSITGALPTVVDTGDKDASLVLTEDQTRQMRAWLDKQLFSMIVKPAPLPGQGSLNTGMGPVLVPWALKYVVPVIVAFIAIGWIGHRYLAR